MHDIEQMRTEQRTDDFPHHHNELEPFGQAIAMTVETPEAPGCPNAGPLEKRAHRPGTVLDHQRLPTNSIDLFQTSIRSQVLSSSTATTSPSAMQASLTLADSSVAKIPAIAQFAAMALVDAS